MGRQAETNKITNESTKREGLITSVGREFLGESDADYVFASENIGGADNSLVYFNSRLGIKQLQLHEFDSSE